MPWASLIATYSGARLEEIAQLKVSDIREKGSTTRRLEHAKKQVSERLVPVHSKLVQAGFLDYVKALPKDDLLCSQGGSEIMPNYKHDWVGPLLALLKEQSVPVNPIDEQTLTEF